MKTRVAFALFGVSLLSLFAQGQAQPQESAEGRRRIVAKVAPQYPNLARSMRLQGSVRADVLVAANGKVKSIEMKGGHPLLEQSAQDALHQWKWEEAPHETHEAVELRFAP